MLSPESMDRVVYKALGMTGFWCSAVQNVRSTPHIVNTQEGDHAPVHLPIETNVPTTPESLLGELVGIDRKHHSASSTGYIGQDVQLPGIVPILHLLSNRFPRISPENRRSAINRLGRWRYSRAPHCPRMSPCRRSGESMCPLLCEQAYTAAH